MTEDADAWVPVEHIDVVRADSNTVSNYIMCNRICQQIQIADLVVVDVSIENANVFYEFGMAVAAEKLILPICFSESFYQFSLPEGARECLEERRRHCEKESAIDHKWEMESFRRMVEHHIDCYPWRRKLFEYFGIRYRYRNSNVGYTNLEDISNPLYGFRDSMYSQVPYDAEIERGETVGKRLYSRLGESYNTSFEENNTVVLYNMNGILNEEQAGQCIINFYRNMTAQVRADFCFCGDRIGVMGQSGVISDDPKDSKTGQKPLYRVDDIIRTAMNEASDEAQKHLVKPADYLLVEQDKAHAGSQWHDQAIENTKNYVKKRCIPINSDEPVHVWELLCGVQKGILSDELLQRKQYENGLDYRHFFCLFHVTLHTLRYTNELVVDLSHNSLPALFWLGVAHGSNVPAITVRHIPTREELRLSGTTEPAESRSIFDVEGLSTVVLNSNDIAGFFNQLTKTQISIEQNRKMALSSTEMERFREGVLNASYDMSPYVKHGFKQYLRCVEKAEQLQNAGSPVDGRASELYKEMHGLISASIRIPGMKEILETLSARSHEDGGLLESYYRRLFWERMLCCSELKLYIPQHQGFDSESNMPRYISLGWCTDAAAELSSYISRHAPNGNSRIHMLREDQPAPMAHQVNYISIGGKMVPLGEFRGGSLAEEHACAEFMPIEKYFQAVIPNETWERTGKGTFQLPSDIRCQLCQNKRNIYEQLAQMILWREVPENPKNQNEKVKYWVSLIGVSGPATLALTSLLVNDDQKWELFGWLDEKKKPAALPLNTLQTEIRESLMEHYEDVLIKQLGKKGLSSLCSKVCYSTKLYLSTVLYQYFFPFLSKADEKRICNGMHAYVSSGGFIDMFEKDHKMIEQAVNDALAETISSFMGVEALYTVEVIKSWNKDDCIPKDIHLLRRDPETPMISCLFKD